MKKQILLLKRLNAPTDLIRHFEEKFRINEQLPLQLRANVATLLEEACREFGFHDVLEGGWFFRPSSLAGKWHRPDTAVVGTGPEDPAIEQAYRRGFVHGFADCRSIVADEATFNKIEARERELTKWRHRTIQRFRSYPGDTEKASKNLFGGRATLTVSRRWAVFKRDGNKCVVCGAGALDGVRLEVDHIKPVSKGGSDDMDNLQTLCRDCNAGKSDTG